MKMKKKKDRKKIKDDDNGVVIVAVDNYNTIITRPTTTTTGSNSKGNNNKILRLFVLFLIVGISTIFYDSKYISNYQIMTKMKSNDLIYNYDNEEDDGVVVVVNNTVRENGQQSQSSRDNEQEQQQPHQQPHQQLQQQPPQQPQQQPPQQNQTDMSFEEVMREKKKKEEEQDTEDDDNDRVDRRPYLILHVGPPKTGTTTIQSGLFKILKELAIHDNYYYLGSKIGGNVKTIRFQNNNNNEEERQNHIRKGNSVTTTKVFPMKDFVRGPSQEFCNHIKYHLQQKHNVILSSEHFTTHFLSNKGWKRLYKHIFLMNQNKKSKSNLNNTNTTNQNNNTNSQNSNLELLFGFNVKIITTYRHLFQWLPSYYHQTHLSDLAKEDKKPIGIVDYIQDYIINNQNYLMENTTTTKVVHLDKNVKSWLGSKENGSGNPTLIHGSIWSYLFWSEQIKSSSNSTSRGYGGGELYNRVHVFDMHQQELELNLNLNNTNINTTQPTTNNYDMFTNFICQMIPNAKHTCQLLQQQEEEQQQRQRQKQDQDQGSQRSGGHHKRSSHTINEYLSFQDRYRIYQMARYGYNNSNNNNNNSRTDTDTGTTDDNRIVIQIFNFTYNKKMKITSKKITDRMENWFHLQEQNNSNSTTSTDTDSTVFSSFQRQRMKMNSYFRCLTDTNLQQLKQLSWNFLLQQILLVRIHNHSLSNAYSNLPNSNSNSNSISSDNNRDHDHDQKTTTTNMNMNMNTNLILSSQFDFNNINININRNMNRNKNDELLELLDPLKMNHDTLFHNYANNNKFCQINPEKILTNTDFVQYVFQNKYYE